MRISRIDLQERGSGGGLALTASPGMPYKHWSAPTSLDELIKELEAHKV